MGHQGTLGIVTEATLEIVPKPEAEFAAFFAFDDYLKAHRTVYHIVTSGIATLAGTVLFDEKKVEYLRRDDEAFIPMPPWVNSIVATALYGTKAEVTAASKILMEKGRAEGGRYTGDHMAVGDWASRHDRYANPLHGRIPDGQVVPMSWHCEDASTELDSAATGTRGVDRDRAALHRRVGNLRQLGHLLLHQRLIQAVDDYLAEIDIGIWEEKLDDDNWAAWVRFKSELAQVSLKYGGSMSNCHGTTVPVTPNTCRRKWVAAGM